MNRLPLKSAFRPVVFAALVVLLLAAFPALAQIGVEGGSQRRGIVGTSTALNWRINSALPSSPNAIDLVVVSMPHSVRLAGDDFYAYPPGEALPFGIAVDADKFHAVFPLYLLEEPNARTQEIRFMQTGAHRVAVSHVAVDRRSLAATVQSRQEIGFDIADGRPRLIVSDVARADAAPKSRTLAPDGKTQVVVFDDDFELRDPATDLPLLRLAGTEPAYSPTGRFVMFNTGSLAQAGKEAFIADTQSLEVFHLAYGTVVGWARGDAVLLIAKGQAMPGVQIVDTFVNRRLRDGEPESEFEYTRVDVDRRFPLRLFDLFACMACENEDIWFRLIPEYGFALYSFQRDHSDPRTRAGDFINAQSLLDRHRYRQSDAPRAAGSGDGWEQGAAGPPIIPTDFSIAKGWNVGAGLTAPGSVRPAARPVATIAPPKPGENVGRIVRSLLTAGEVERRTLPDQLSLSFGVELMEEDLEQGAPPSPADFQRLAASAKSGSQPYDEFGSACALRPEVCASPFQPSSWRHRLPDGRLLMVEFAELGGGATGRIEAGEIWLGIAGAGRGAAHRLVEIASPSLAAEIAPIVFDSKWLVVFARGTNTIVVIDLATEKIIRVRGVDWWNAASLVPLSGRPVVMQQNYDGALYFYDLNRAELVLRGQFVDDELVLFTEDGRFDATGDGAHHARLLFPGRREHHSFAQFRQALYNPAAIAQILQGRAAAAGQASLPVPPDVDFRVQSAGPGAYTARAGIRADTPLKSVAFYVDGQKLLERPLQGRSATVEEKLSVPAGGHWLTAVATDQRGITSAAKTSFVSVAQAGAPAPGALHMLAIGINQYKLGTKDATLTAAVPDAVALAEAARKYGGKQYRAVNATVLKDAEATGERILRAVTTLAEQAAAGDTVVIFTSAHGIRDNSGNYYIVAHDTDMRSDEARVMQTAVPWAKLGEALARSKARVLVLLDTCHAGAAGENALAPNDFTVKALRAANAPGIMIMAAAKGRQYAQERELPGVGARGLFAHAVESAIGMERQAADLDGNGVIEASELYRFVKFRVWQQTDGKQTPWIATTSIEGEVALF